MADLKLYFSSTVAADHTCAYSGSWNQTGEALRREASTSKTSSAMGDAYVSETSATNPLYVLNRMYVSIPLAAAEWKTSGKFSGVVRAVESGTAANATLYLIIRVAAGDGASYRGTLYEGEVNATEFDASTRTARYFEDIAIQNAVSMQENDHLVIEVGTKFSNADTAGRWSRIVFGDDSDTDLPLNNTDTNVYNPWMEFTYGAAASNVTPEAALISGAGDQPAPAVMGDANLAPNSIDQETELVDPDIDTTQNLGVGNYRSTKVTMNW